VPSTTSAALPALWSGRDAAEHGITGYEMWMKEYGVIANAILHAPITYRDDVGSLERAGFDPEKFLPFPTLGTHLLAHGVEPYALQHRRILRSGLSKMLFRDVDAHAFHTAADLWINLRHLLEEKARQRLYVWAYWSEVDHFGHLYGPDDERTVAEFATFSLAMEQFFLARIGATARQGTLLILTADHGQIATRKDPHYELRHHPDLLRCLHISPTGENRLAYLYIRPGQSEAVYAYLERTWPGQFCVIETAHAIENGLFGPGSPHPALQDRLGDAIVVAREDAYLWWPDRDNHLFGRHGGLHPDEMLVPFLTVRL
jgi:predicted AlkP superfamily pyrophosphatase or phosphodiesterase